jgi:Tfp pilus assembly protein PilN
MRHEINLFDPALRKPRVLLPARQVALGWGACIAILLAAYGWHSVEWMRVQADQKRSAESVMQLQEEVKRIAGTLSARKASPEALERVQRREAEVTARARVLERLQRGDLGSRDGHSALLQSLARNAVPGLWLTAITVQGAANDVLLEGRTADPGFLPEYLARLGRDDPLRGHAFNALRVSRPAEDTAAQTEGKRAAAPWLEFRVASRLPGEPKAVP